MKNFKTKAEKIKKLNKFIYILYFMTKKYSSSQLLTIH